MLNKDVIDSRWCTTWLLVLGESSTGWLYLYCIRVFLATKNIRILDREFGLSRPGSPLLNWRSRWKRAILSLTLCNLNPCNSVIFRHFTSKSGCTDLCYIHCKYISQNCYKCQSCDIKTIKCGNVCGGPYMANVWSCSEHVVKRFAMASQACGGIPL